MYEEYYDAFAKSPFCREIKNEDYEEFLLHLQAKLKKYAQNDYIVRSGNPVNGCYMVLRGEVIQYHNNLYGDKAVFDKFTEGHMFGEIVLMLPHRTHWSFNFVAKTECTLLFFSMDMVQKALLDPSIFTNRIYYNYVYSVCTYVEKQMIALRSLRNTTVRQKISSYLYEQCLLHNKKQLTIPFNRTDFAAFLFMPQTSLSRELSKMRKEGLIDFHKDTIKIIDSDALSNGST